MINKHFSLLYNNFSHLPGIHMTPKFKPIHHPPQSYNYLLSSF